MHLVGFIIIAVCTVKNSWWWTEELSEARRVLYPKLISEISASSWFYYNRLKKFLVLFLKRTADVLHAEQKTTAGSAQDIFSTYTTPRNIHVSGCKYYFSNTILYTNAMRKYKILNPFLNTLCTTPVA